MLTRESVYRGFGVLVVAAGLMLVAVGTLAVGAWQGIFVSHERATITLEGKLEGVKARSDGWTKIRVREFPYKTFLVPPLREADTVLLTSVERKGAKLRFSVDAAEFRNDELTEAALLTLETPTQRYSIPGDQSETYLPKVRLVVLVLVTGLLATAGGLIQRVRKLGAVAESGTTPTMDPWLLALGRFASRAPIIRGSAGSWAWVHDALAYSAERERTLADRPETEKPRELAAIEGLIKSEGGIDTKNANGQTALHVASGAGKSDAVDLLLRNGASPSATDSDGKTPLMIAAERGHLGVVMRLLEVGASVSATDRNGKTALALAESAKKEACAREIAKISQSGGNFPLHDAAKSGRLDLVHTALARGADIDQLDNGGKTALVYAVEGDFLGVARLLAEHGAEVAAALIVAQEMKRAEIAATLQAIAEADSKEDR